MKNITLIVSTSIILLFVAGALFMSLRPQSKGPIRLGFVGPLTGGPAVWGEGAKNMLELAVNEINAEGGIKGRPIEVTYEDGKCTGQDAVSATRKLVNQNIKYIIGGHCSPETIAMVPLSKNSQFLMIAGVTAADNAVAGSDSAFRTSPANKDFTDRMVPMAIAKYKRVAILNEQTAYAKGFADDFDVGFKKAGGTVVARQEYATDHRDFRSQLLALKQQDPEAIFVSPQNPATAITALEQMAELGFTYPVFGNSVLVTKEVFKQANAPALFTDMFSVVPYADQNNKKVKELQQKYRDRYGKDVPYNFSFVGATYDAMYLLKDAIGRCGEEVSCAASYLRKTKHEGATANYTFKENGDSTFDRFAKLTITATGEEKVDPLSF